MNIDFNFGRLLQTGEKLTTARINAIVRGISATISGLIGNSDLAPGAVTPDKVTPGGYFFAANCVLLGGTYTITGFPVNPPSLTAGMVLSFKASAINTGAVNLTVNALPTYTLTKYGGQPLAAGDIQAGQVVMIQLTDTLLAQPTWEMVSLPGNQIVPSDRPVLGSMHNLIAKNGAGSPTTQVEVLADELLLKDASGRAYLAAGFDVTATLTATGANGLDTGTRAVSTWYYVWVIYNPTTNTVAALFSLSATAPTLPSGYTFKALASVARNDGSNNLVTLYQQDQNIYVDQTNIFTAKAAAASDTYELYSAGAGGGDVDLRTIIPPVARKLRGTLGNSDTTNNQAMIIAADANGLGAAVNVAQSVGPANAADGFTAGNGFEIPLKTAQTVYWKTTSPAARNRLSVSGYQI